MLGIIGGSGLTELPHIAITRRQVVQTPNGVPSRALCAEQISLEQIKNVLGPAMGRVREILEYWVHFHD